MLLGVFVQIFYIDRRAVLDHHMTGLYFWKMRLEDLRRIVHSNRNNGTAGLAGNLKASLMKRKKFGFVLIIISGAFRKNTD